MPKLPDIVLKGTLNAPVVLKGSLSKPIVLTGRNDNVVQLRGSLTPPVVLRGQLNGPVRLTGVAPVRRPTFTRRRADGTTYTSYEPDPTLDQTPKP